ncbi:MAG: DNA adenine methylase [Lachnospiraceae bacterium]
MRYLGNKETIVSKIYNIFKDKKIINKNFSFFDAFCGSGSVADYFKEYYDTIIINDNLLWSVVYSHGKLLSIIHI